MRKLLLSTFLLFSTLSVFAQGGIPLKTGQKYVTAVVDHGSGWVQVRRYPGNNMDGILSYYQKSFVSFNVNGKVYTNNDVGLASPLPANTFIMKDGVLSRIKGKSSNTDTIRCVWPNKDGVDLIQEVYPVLFDHSEQIVFRWKVINKTTASITVALQYLLDMQVGDQEYTNDGAPVLTRNGYSPDWFTFDGSVSKPIPPYFIGFQYPLPHPPSFDPGLEGTGFTDSTYSNLGLIKPKRLTIGNWPELIQVRLGPPLPLPNGQYEDCAILFEYNQQVVPKNNEFVIASTSYGTGEFPKCTGQLFGLLFYPQTKHYTARPKPEEFDIEMHLFNPSTIQANGIDVSLRVGAHLKITAPQPTLDSNRVQVQQVSNGGNIAGYGVSIAKWKVKIDTAKFPRDDFSSLLKFRASSSNIGQIFVTKTDTCEQLINFDLPDYDNLAPVFKELTPIDSSIRHISFSEIRALDSGLKSINWFFLAPTDSSNFIITPQSIVGTCMKGIDTITIVQKDTTKGGCIYFTALDCGGNRTETTYCVVGKVYVPPDTLPPLIFDRVNIDKYQIEFKVADNRPDDGGLKEILAMNSSFDTVWVSLNRGIFWGMKDTVLVTVAHVDSLKSGCAYLRITDVAGNVTFDTTCFVADTSLGVTDKQDESAFSILGNPSSGRATIHLTLEKVQDVTLRIVDALGREVRRVDVKGLMQGENLIPLQTSELASGTYYVIVEIDGKQFTKSLKVVR